MRRPRALWAFLISLCLMGTSGCGRAAEPASKAGTPVDVTLTDLDGKSVSLSQFRGKKVYVKFWASWCPRRGSRWRTGR